MNHDRAVSRERWNARYRKGDVTWADEPVEFVVRSISGIPPGRALDLGCGPGRHAIYLAAQGWRVCGVDFSEESITIARERDRCRGARVEWVTSDVLDLEMPAGAYRLILISYLHIPHSELVRLISRCEHALERGGRLIVVGHDVANIREGTGRPRHKDVAYTTQLIADALSRCTVVHAARRSRPPDHGTSPVHPVDSSEPGSAAPRLQIDTEVIVVRDAAGYRRAPDSLRSGSC